MILLLWGWGFSAHAQMPEQASSMPEQWQMTLDGIKTKAQTLVVENNGLQVEYQQLIGEAEKLQQSIQDQQYKNEQMGRFLKERHGRTDRQVRIDELNQMIKTKRQGIRASEKQLGNWKRKQSLLDHKIQLLKYTISDLEFRQQAQKQKVQASRNPQPQADSQLTQLRMQLEDENKQEVLLENQLKDFKTIGQAQNLNGDVKNTDRYDQLKKRKDQLEININAYEMRLGELRESTLGRMSWSLKKKKLVHEMVETDARNNKMRDMIKALREDIAILKNQVAGLERKVNFVQGKKTK